MRTSPHHSTPVWPTRRVQPLLLVLALCACGDDSGSVTTAHDAGVGDTAEVSAPVSPGTNDAGDEGEDAIAASDLDADTGTDTRCGDGIVDETEECDDGNAIDDDGCDNTCQLTPAILCAPCTRDADCGRSQDRCLLLEDGYFCGRACTQDDCPGDYACSDDEDGAPGALQCVPLAGHCGCEDADGDGICDEEDGCEGGDDGADADGDGVPDDCDCGDEGRVCDPQASCQLTGDEWLCVCDEGWTDDGGVCVDVDECLTPGACAPDAFCENLSGGYDCHCDPGYWSVNPFVVGCLDIDECTSLEACGLGAVCTNAAGDYRCDCPDGFTSEDPDTAPCLDVDECADEPPPCDPLTECVNASGGFSCTPCPVGYIGSGESGCVDADDCLVDNGGCDPLVACIDYEGGRLCGDCPDGYEGSGDTGCVDVDECMIGLAACDPLTACINTAGGYACDPCPEGYTGTGETGCADFDECAANICHAEATCTNLPGDFTCVCNDGFTGDGLTCEVSSGREYGIGWPSDSSWTAGAYFRGNAYRASFDGWVESFSQHLGLTGSCVVDFYIHQGPSATGPWTTVWAGSQTFGAGDGHLDSGPIGYATSAGNYYALGVGWNCTATYYGNNAGWLGADAGFGAFEGNIWDNAYRGLADTYSPPNAGGSTLAYEQFVIAND